MTAATKLNKTQANALRVIKRGQERYDEASAEERADARMVRGAQTTVLANGAYVGGQTARALESRGLLRYRFVGATERYVQLTAAGEQALAELDAEVRS